MSIRIVPSLRLCLGLCVRNKLQPLTVPLNLKLFLWILVCAWTAFPLSISRNWSSKYLHSSKNLPIRRDPLRDETQRKHTNTKTKKHIKRDDVKLFNVDHVTTNAKPSHFCALLYIFEDEKAVIKIIIKGRSPTMRHASRTHRVALDWLLDRIILDPKLQIHTKHQLADC